MNLPPYGFCCPCRFVRLLEPDRIVVRLRTEPPQAEEVWTIRLSSVAALPSQDTPQGRAATDFVENLLDDFGDSLSAFVASPAAVLQRYSRGRTFEGEVFLGTEQRLSEALIRAGHGTATQHLTPDVEESSPNGR